MKRADQLRRRGMDKGALRSYYDSACRIRDREPGLLAEEIADHVLSGLGNVVHATYRKELIRLLDQYDRSG